jgi:hypothetical protein
MDRFIAVPLIGVRIVGVHLDTLLDQIVMQGAVVVACTVRRALGPTYGILRTMGMEAGSGTLGGCAVIVFPHCLHFMQRECSHCFQLPQSSHD